MVVHDPTPAYHSASQPSTVHTFPKDGSEVGLQVRFASHAVNPASTPTFYDLSTLAGTVEVSFRKNRKIDSIGVKLVGYEKIDLVQWLDQEEKHHDRVFLQQSEDLWATTENGASLAPGTHSWSFSFSFPEQTLDLGKSGKPYPLPPTFTTEYFPDHLVYELVVVAKRGSFFHQDEYLVVPVKFVPRHVAAAPSPARALSYERGTALLGPDEDPDGWTTTNVQLRGVLFGTEVAVDCDLSLASPLDYARGYPIPFVLKIASENAQALAMFSASTGISVNLNRVVARFKRARASDIVKSKPVSNGRYWLVQESGNTKTLYGEIPVTLSVSPGFSYKTLSVLYYVALTPTVAGFDVKGEKVAQTTNVPVNIAYFPPPGVKPRSFAPAAADPRETSAPPPAFAPQAALIPVA